MARWCSPGSTLGAARVAVLFPPQVRDWGLPAEAPLTPRAGRRVAREGALHSFDQAALALNEDWGTHLDGKQIQRWAEAMGRVVVRRREQEVEAYEQGHRPASPVNASALLVIGMDGGRVQTREKQGENGSRGREDRVSVIPSYLPGDGTPDHPPTPLVTTYVATMEKTEAFGKLVHVEAERRGMRQAATVLVMGDGGNWIDPLPAPGEGGAHPRRGLASNVGYFQTHRHHMDYPTFRRKGWPIGSGVTESAVKQFNKRVKGTEQFWSMPGVESILSLRALWLSQDGRGERYWNTRPAYSKAA